MTDEQVALKFRLLLHFRGTGNATDKEYQELDDVSASEVASHEFKVESFTHR